MLTFHVSSYCCLPLHCPLVHILFLSLVNLDDVSPVRHHQHAGALHTHSFYSHPVPLRRVSDSRRMWVDYQVKQAFNMAFNNRVAHVSNLCKTITLLLDCNAQINTWKFRLNTAHKNSPQPLDCFFSHQWTLNLTPSKQDTLIRWDICSASHRKIVCDPAHLLTKFVID